MKGNESSDSKESVTNNLNPIEKTAEIFQNKDNGRETIAVVVYDAENTLSLGDKQRPETQSGDGLDMEAKQQENTDVNANDGGIYSNSEFKPCFTGLTNLGNTCYMNTSLQALYATPEFLDHLSHYESEGGPLLRALLYLFHEIDNTSRYFVNPHNFRSVFTDIKPQFKGREQQDAQEFLRFIIDNIHEEINEAKQRRGPKLVPPKTAAEAWEQYKKYIDDSFLVHFFVGQYTSIIMCTFCHKTRYCWDTFWDLSLSLPEEKTPFNIKDLINNFCKIENLDDAYCSHCKQNRNSTKGIQITRLPLILIIHLKMFDNNGQKVSREDMTINQDLTIKNINFVLYACICHRGFTSYSGHYTVYCKHNNTPDCMKWSYIDDEDVYGVDDISTDQMKGSYILFYHRKQFARYDD